MSRRIESKHFEKSMKQAKVFSDFGLLLRRELTASNKSVAAPVVERSFLKPNWKAGRMLFSSM